MDFKNSSDFEELYTIVKHLRGENGCPWDKKQTRKSMLPYLIEETYECIDAVDSGDSRHVAEEIGDIFLILAMIITIADEEDEFTPNEVFRDICDKIIRRHPHVFGDFKADTPDEVVKKWDEIKENVEGRKSKEYLSTVPKTIPPLEKAYSLQKKASKAGFDWETPADVFKKLREEIDELEEVFNKTESKERKYEEFGDTVFSLINVGRFLKLDPALALHRANRKFYKRFAYIETKMKETGLPLSKAYFEKMDSLWNEAKEKKIK